MEVIVRRLAALLILALLAFFSPILGAVNRPVTVWGIPLLPLYLFTVWTALVVGTWALTRERGQ